LNACDRSQFVTALGWIFERSPWVAERAWARRPFASIDELHGAMVSAMLAATPDEQLSLLRAHPDLGTRMRMSDASTSEQARAGLDSLTGDEFARLQQLNTEYREKFGFPFVFAVRGSTKHDVLAALATRVTDAVETEWAEALRQVARIAAFRLKDTVSST
jgi:2-oxo-4-hydroxy-4-carboxy-5-ureidoimidazoline decarboxylase